MRSHTIHDRANLNVEVSMAAFSMGDRRKRSRGDKYDLYSLSTSRTKKGLFSFLMVQAYFGNFNHYQIHF